MSVKLYPDHKAILHFHDSLKVFEIDFLDYLMKFLTQEEYGHRRFEIYVKPTLAHSALDFVILEPNHALYVIQTPETADQYHFGNDTLAYLKRNRLYVLSTALYRRIQRTVSDNRLEKTNLLIKQLFYLYDETAMGRMNDELLKENTFLTVKDFQTSSPALKAAFEHQEDADIRLTNAETVEIQQTLNPKTNIKNYITKSLPREYQEFAKSIPQSKQKFKGASGSGKTLLLTKRIINCANRLLEKGKILVIAGDITKVNSLKDLITAEDGRSLQELGIDVSSFQDLIPPKEKYHALFIDDAEYLQPAWFNYLLEHYLVEMTEDNDYEYVVMANEGNLPAVAQIYGPYRTLKYDLRRMHRLLSDSREIFLDILTGG